MKQVHATYSFVSSTKTITLTGLNIDQDQLLLIVNATRGVQYFNFADSSLRATVTPGANTTVVLTDASTTGHANGDALVIYYDDQVTSQVVSGTVTANPGTGAFTVSGTVGLDNASLVALENITVTVGSSVALAAGSAQIGSVTVANFPANQTVAGTVTVGNFPSTQTIAGTVTANVFGQNVNGGAPAAIPIASGNDSFAEDGARLGVQLLGRDGLEVGQGSSCVLPISGTVTANVFGSGFLDQPYAVPVMIDGGDSVTRGLNIGFHEDLTADEFRTVKASEPFPVQIRKGTVTIGANPSGALTTRFGSVTTANTAQITSAVTNTSRKYLLAQNISAGTVTIGIGFSPTTTQGIQLPAGGGLTFDAFCPTGAVYWLGAVTGAAFTILEG